MSDLFAGDLFVEDGSIMDDHCYTLLKDNTNGFAARAAIHQVAEQRKPLDLSMGSIRKDALTKD